MSLHRITAGSGYDYLTRQVAAMDSTEKGYTGLASYYTEKGETPGTWVGSGLAGIEGLAAGDVVTAEQMQALFGAGLHPLARQRSEALGGTGATEADYLEATRLGRPFAVYNDDVSPFRVEVARRLEQLNTSRGLPVRTRNSIEDRARIRSEVAAAMFREQYGRAPLDQRELAGHIAKLSRQKTTAVAGFDLTFSPVKSVSTLWAIADQPVAAVIERAHNAAVAEALAFIERTALYTRTGTAGVRQVDVRGLIGTAFVHRDSRAGDPDLHTHVAVANKVQTVEDGRWLSIDGRVLFKGIVAASETYNTALEQHLATELGLRFEERPNPDRRKLPVREVVGVDPALNARWSQRRQSIEARRRVLAKAFQRDHGRPPTPVEAIALAQQATLETREDKHEPRSLAEQRATWYDQAVEVLGGSRQIAAMIRHALHPDQADRQMLDQRWFDDTVAAMLARMETNRSTWQDWHLRAEALRRVRAAEAPLEHTGWWVDHLVAAAIARSVPVTRTTDGVDEPDPLRRASGDSVYTVAGAQLFTSGRVLAAEQRLVDAAGRRGGMVADPTAIDLALLESEANRVRLNPGQVLLVREMASSGARVQLAIAPAGSGKTTAMDALSRAWIASGGNVIGLAPSAAAAAQLGAQMQGHHDTLAKLVWDLTPGLGDPSAWKQRIGQHTLVVIDEAGMADTVSLDTAVNFILERGGSVRLIGDDQQLAAIGAGGVLRDIQAQHGALRLTELLRFSDPAEGSASLALREGHTAALGFYLDQHRLHVGDEATMADDLFDAWSADREQGLDSIMLAPTRERVSELNQRARTQRLAGTTPHRQIELADGNQASIGDVIITRQNNRLLRVAANDWVKNGDRWTVTGITLRGGIRARHNQSGRYVTLPAEYVAEQVELGYASTIHTAQGITADTMHGLLTGAETRQQAYTMLTRGRHHNAAYVVVVCDGDPHTTIRPEVVNPLTPTDILHAILARDESPISATTQLRDAGNPTALLHQAVTRYTDATSFAASHIAGEFGIRGLQRRAEEALPRITTAAAWPSLQAELLLVEADGHDPIDALARATADPIGTAHDPVAVLAWRVADQRHHTGRGPLPWLAGIPTELAQHPLWNQYLGARQTLIRNLVEQIRANQHEDAPAWVASLASVPPASLIAEVEVWRAANGVPDTDLRPTGERRHASAAGRYQQRLEHRLQTSQSAALDEWRDTLAAISPAILVDDFAPVLARRLAQLSSSGINARGLIDQAAAQGPLPDDHAAAALWWRLARHLTPAVAEGADTAYRLTTEWLDQFARAVNPDTAHALADSASWPALVATIERGLQRGWHLDRLLDDARRTPTDPHLDPCQAWVWRLSILTDPTPYDNLPDVEDEPPADLWEGLIPTTPSVTSQTGPAIVSDPPTAEESLEEPDLDAEQALAIEAIVRRGLPAPEPTDAEIRAMLERRDAWRDSPPLDRLIRVNDLTADYYQQRYTDSWARGYVTERFGHDLTGSEVRPGYAPDSWTALVTHLHLHGVTDEEMLAAGVATRASTGWLIDRFRDRVTFPITNPDGHIVGFVGRRNPVHTDADGHGPKYLNTAETALYRKGDQLFTAGHLSPDTIPVLTEGPFDAIAVTIAAAGSHTGVAALGTSLTNQQAAQLRGQLHQPIVATDPDLAGRIAAERDYWLLAAQGLDPRFARLPEGQDPAELARADAGLLTAALRSAGTLGNQLIDERLDHLPTNQAALEAATVVAAQPPERWTAGVEYIAERTDLPATLIRAALVGLVRTWNEDPRRSADQHLGRVAETKERLTTPDPDEALASRGEQADPNRQRKLPERRIENAAQRSTNVPR
ncbi:MAG: relaxase domain-containing protein [Actinobacteria bacterium]|jgi:DNA primase catalytic core|nr:relaxase domain-containing protein [Actinomycetota bacterium]